MTDEGIVFEGDTAHGHYLVADTRYSNRPARVLYSGQKQAAQSGIAFDDRSDLLFDYNERFMELIRGLLPKKVLLIGGGAFTLPKAVNECFPQIKLDIIELDPGLLDIGQKYFHYKPNRNTKVTFGDGREYLNSSKQIYDLIIVDAFDHSTIPTPLQTAEAYAAYKRHLHETGVVAINVISTYYGRRSASLRSLIAGAEGTFSYTQLYPAGRSISYWLPQNFVFTAQNFPSDLGQFLRFEELGPLSVQPSDALRD